MYVENSKTQIAIFVVTLCVIFLVIFSNKFGTYTSYFIGKIQHGADLQLKGFNLVLPDDWWIIEKSNSRVTLGKLPSTGNTNPLFIFIDERIVSENVVDYFGQLKTFGDSVTARKKQSKKDNIK